MFKKKYLINNILDKNLIFLYDLQSTMPEKKNIKHSPSAPNLSAAIY